MWRKGNLPFDADGVREKRQGEAGIKLLAVWMVYDVL